MTKINTTEFSEKIANLCLIDFYADWCGPCKMLAPFLEQLSEKYPNIEFYKVNVDDDGSIAAKYSISSIPTLMLFNNNEMLARREGFATVAALSQWIDENIQ